MTLCAAVLIEAELLLDGVNNAVPSSIVLHEISPLLKTIRYFEDLFAAEAAGAFDAVPNAVIDPRGLVVIKQVNGEALALDGGVIVGVVGHKIVEQGAGIPGGAVLGDF